MEGSYRALTLALAAFFCGGCGRAVHPKLHTGLLQVLLEHPTQSRNVALWRRRPWFEPLIMIEARGRNPPGESLYDLDSRQMCQVFIIYMFVPSHWANPIPDLCFTIWMTEWGGGESDCRLSYDCSWDCLI
jgi:hypothetical protein